MQLILMGCLNLKRNGFTTKKNKKPNTVFNKKLQSTHSKRALIGSVCFRIRYKKTSMADLGVGIGMPVKRVPESSYFLKNSKKHKKKYKIMNATITVKVASFLEAFNKFLSYSDGSLSINELASFVELKDKRRISFSNKTQYWNGNHSNSSSYVELLLVEEPCTFYVVKYHYSECSDNSHSKDETTVFVPNEKE